jgi:7-cyano-7-deazaguanine synthase
MPETSSAAAVLLSGGLDSAILLGEVLREHSPVHPLYVQSGLFWEPAELEHLHRFLAWLGADLKSAAKHSAAKHSAAKRSAAPLTLLQMPVADLYGDHWSITGRNVPDARTPDEAVFLPGRNVLLLAKAMLWCHLHRVPTLMLGVLGANPFADATPDFFARFQAAVNQAVSGRVQVCRPFAGLSKVEVLRRGRELPLELTFSCIQPKAGLHCGCCNKCAERIHAFRAAGLEDRTAYHPEGACTA